MTDRQLSDFTVDDMQLADKCRHVELRNRYSELCKIAVELHLLANTTSGERYTDGRSDRARAEQGYKAEFAVAQFYGLRPELDYRPPGEGDLGRDFYADYNGECVSIDVKSTSTTPPKLYLTQKRSWSDEYVLPDYYLLASGEVTDDDAVHLVGWCSSEEIKAGREAELYGNEVWIKSFDELRQPPKKRCLSQISQLEELKEDVNRLAEVAD